jgi:hypothetical protein
MKIRLKLSIVYFVLFLMLGNVLLVLSNSRVIWASLHTPPGYIYYFLHFNYLHDYTNYLSAVTQGVRGDWLYTNPYTTEPATSGIFYIYYVLIGKIGALFGAESPIIYLVARLVCVEGFFIGVYLFSKMVLGRTRAFWGATAALLSTIPASKLNTLQLPYPYFTPWWQGLEAIERLNDLGHNVAGQFLLVVTFVCTALLVKTGKIRFACIGVIAAFSGSIFFPPIIAPIVMVLPISIGCVFLVRLLKKKPLGVSRRTLVFLAAIVLSALIAFLLIRFQERQGFPWSIWTPWNLRLWNVQETNFNPDAISCFTLLILLAIPGFIAFLSNATIPGLMTVVWAIMPFALLPFVDIAQIPKLRLFQSAPFVPFGILIAGSMFAGPRGRTGRVWSVLVLIGFLGITLPSTYTAANAQIINASNIKAHLLSKTGYDAIEYIRYSVPKRSVILAEYLSLMITAYTPTMAYFGHPGMTINIDEKYRILRSFYDHSMNDTEAEQFLKKNNISYVWLGINERQMSHGDLTYPFLTPVYKNPDIILYRVQWVNPS